MEQGHDLLFHVLDGFVCTLVGGISSFVWEIYEWILFPYQWTEQKFSNFIERQRFCVLSNFMTKGYWSSHNETAASAWQQWNADWWSEMKKANHNTHHSENSPTNSCGTIDTDDEATGRLRSTDLHHIIVAALEGHEKQSIHYHVLRNNYTSLMCASYLANHPYENFARSPIFKQQNVRLTVQSISLLCLP